MGIDYNTYVGPYLKVKNLPKTSTETYHTCVNKKCDNHKKDLYSQFCSSCGSKVEEMIRSCENTVFVEPTDSFKLHEITFYDSENYDYFIPNDGKLGLWADGRTELEIPIKNNTPENELEKFKSRFKKEISILHKEYGENLIEVKWGVLIWCS